MLPSHPASPPASGAISQPENIAASSFNSITHAPVNQTFQWKAEPVGNNTANPSATLNLLFGSGTAPVETGFHIAGNGRITFASGQTFPGTGSGTVTSVNSGTGLTGGPITGSGTLRIAPAACAAGNALSALPFTCSPFATLGANIFTGLQTINSGEIITTTSNGAALTVTQSGGTGDGIHGTTSSSTGYGVVGAVTATTGFTSGVLGVASGIYGHGVWGQGASGVRGDSTFCNTGPGTLCEGGSFYGFAAPAGSGYDGGYGLTSLAGDGDLTGSFTTGGTGVYGVGGSGYSVDGDGAWFIGGSNAGQGDGVLAWTGSGFAGNFVGDLTVSGAITAGTKDFKIDHPLDPANKYLVHASVESSEMKNIYDGVVTTDAQGEATVQLPEWFEVLNSDFRYQLTVIGQFAQAIVGRKIQDHQFQIKTNAPNVEVSWQVTGVRQDAYAKAHPLVVEEEKGARLRGFYIHPEFYGAPDENQIEWARHPNMMKKAKEYREKQAQLRVAAKPN